MLNDLPYAIEAAEKAVALTEHIGVREAPTIEQAQLWATLAQSWATIELVRAVRDLARIVHNK